MKKLFALLALVSFCFSARADFTTIALTVTNAPTNGYTITINGNTRTWTNTVFNAGAQIANTNTLGAVATNLFFHLVSAPISGVRPTMNGTNGINFDSFSALTITVSTNWASLSTTNTTTTNALGVIVPFTQYTTTALRQRVASQNLTGINDYATNTFDAGAQALTNHVNRTAAQTISGDKTFTGANTYSNDNQVFSGGTITNAYLSNCIPALTNGTWSNGKATNLVNYGNAFSSPGATYTGTEQFGSGATTAQDDSTALGNTATASGINAVAVGKGSIALGDYATAINGTALANNSTAIGYGAQSLNANEIVLGTSSELVIARGDAQIAGTLQVVGSISNIISSGNSTLNGTNTVAGQIEFSRKNNTSLANGANAAVNVSTNTYVKLSGPSGAFTVNGIAGGRDGRLIILQNSTGFTLTVANDSGVEPTAANRIYTGTGADIVHANNPGCVTLIYDSAVSRWVVVNTN